VSRRYERISTVQAAVITFNGGKDQIACVIRDVSEGGVGLSVASTEDIPDQFILTVKGEDEGRACTVRWRETDKIGASFDGKTHWMVAAGGLLVACAVMICVIVFSLPAFEGYRTALFLFGAAPVAVLGAFMILFQRYRENNLSYRRPTELA
jgi:hypothetical protein